MGFVKPSAKVRCNKCGSEVVIYQVSQIWGVCNGKVLRFAVHECANCGEWNICQIDDAACIKYLGKIASCMGKAADGVVSKKLAGTYRRARKDLVNRRQQLVDSYEGKSIQFTEGDERQMSAGWSMCDAL